MPILDLGWLNFRAGLDHELLFWVIGWFGAKEPDNRKYDCGAAWMKEPVIKAHEIEGCKVTVDYSLGTASIEHDGRIDFDRMQRIKNRIWGTETRAQKSWKGGCKCLIISKRF